MKPRILLDVDGVLADFLGFTIQTVAELSGKTFLRSDFLDWNLFATIDPALRYDFYHECSRPGVASSLEVCEGALEGVRRLQELGEVYAVTAPMRNSPFWYSDRESWLERKFGIPHQNLVYTEAKYLCRGDVLVDDKYENVAAWVRENPDGIGLLWDAPYNRQYRDVSRATTWDDVVEAVRLQLERKHNGVFREDSG